MIYKAIGITSRIVQDGLEIVYAHFHERGGQWGVELLHHARYPHDFLPELQNLADLPARAYIELDNRYGRFIGDIANRFIAEFNLEHKVDLIASDGYSVLFDAEKNLQVQIGNGASIAAVTGLPVVSDLRAMDTALGGTAVQISGVAEKLLPVDGFDLSNNEAIIIALHGVLRWREEYTMLASQTGATRNSIGGALWLGGEA